MKPKEFESHTISVSKVINAPLRFVYRWCTDFREDDNRITGSNNKRKILQKNLKRVVYVTTYSKAGVSKVGVNWVILSPPNSWHLDFIGEEDDEEGEYRLTRLAARKTRLDMRFSEKYKVRNAPTQKEDAKHTEEIWDKYVAALEKDYARSVS